MGFKVALPVAMNEGATGGHDFRTRKTQITITVTYRFPRPSGSADWEMTSEISR